MKWTKVEAGEYSAMDGTYTITGSGMNWTLYYDGEELDKFPGKKYAQIAADKHYESDNYQAPSSGDDEDETEVNTEVPPASNLEGTDLEDKLVQVHLTVSTAHMEMIALRKEMKKLREALSFVQKIDLEALNGLGNKLMAVHELIETEFEFDEDEEDEDDEGEEDGEGDIIDI